MDATACSSTDMITEVAEARNVNNDDPKKFDVPPEYDENDSRWTLKYREPAPGLVELIKHSGVYVNEGSLAECQKWSNDCKTFAHMLLTEIFTTSALSTCLWAGTNANDGTHARPGLDERARNVLLNFVVEYGQIRDWARTDYQCIMKGIRQIMLEMRLVRLKKENKVGSDDEHVKEQDSFKNKLLLPPEYNKNNSRWTLKYRDYAPGLVELIDDSCVYVRPTQLAKCKGLADDCVTLARMLLAEIFTTSALSTCSLTGAITANYFDDGKSDTRPGLDENAMNTLLKFVTDIEIEKDDMLTGSELKKHQLSIRNSIKDKMKLLRHIKRTEEEARGDTRSSSAPKDTITKNLPQEYDENNSRWTLKYHESAPGLVELMAHSRVYVNADKLAEFKKLSKNCKTLARKLTAEVFSTSALRTCSLNNKNRQLFRPSYPGDFYSEEEKEKRPELDAHAELILLNFVDEYGLEMGWPIIDLRDVRKSLKDEMRDVKDKYHQKEWERKRAERQRIP